jgi:outer membrane lipoprotein-sorting protein
MRKGLVISVLLMVCNVAAKAQNLSPADVKALLDRIRDRRASSPYLQAQFREQRNVHLLDEPISSSGQVWFQAPNKFRREIKGNAPSVTISDGQQLWIYYSKFNLAERYSLAKRSPLDAGLAALTAGLTLQNFEATYNVTGRKERDQFVLTLQPRAPSIKRLLQRLVITLNSNLQVTRTEMLQPNGDQTVTEYTDHAADPVPADQFEFTPPAGTEVTTPLGR